MFTFHWMELLVILFVGLVLLLGLALLMLRRRNEMLQTFLTPETPSIEQEFFRVRDESAEKQTPEEEDVAEPEAAHTEPIAESEETVHWGIPQDMPPDSPPPA